MIEAIPQGLAISVPPPISLRIGMRDAFVIDVHRMAIPPPEPDWFPDISQPDFILGSVSDRMRRAVGQRVAEMRRRNRP